MIDMVTHTVVFNSRDSGTVSTADGKPAVYYENTVLITETGVEILTL